MQVKAPEPARVGGLLLYSVDKVKFAGMEMAAVVVRNVLVLLWAQHNPKPMW